MKFSIGGMVFLGISKKRNPFFAQIEENIL